MENMKNECSEYECSEYYYILEKMGMRMIENNPDKMKEIIKLMYMFIKKLAEFEVENNIK